MYRGNNNEIFWFSYSDKEKEININILAKHKDDTMPEIKPIANKSSLYKHIEEGNFKLGNNKSFENPVPNLITDSNGKKLCVFTFTTDKCPAPTVYFYDIESKREIAKAGGASIFLNLIIENGIEKLYFYCD